MGLHELLVQRMKENGNTAVQLAIYLNMSLPRISNYLRGKRRPDIITFFRICEFLDIDINQFADEVLRLYSRCDI